METHQHGSPMRLEQEQSAERDRSGAMAPLQRNSVAKEKYAHIQGWGVDLDHANRPAYPMERTPPRLENVHWDHPENQPMKMKVYHSIERQGVTPVFGTSTPPSGMSGMVRDVAYKLSENDIRHWLLLLFADRVNVVEGVIQDLGRGKIPNVFSEMGIRAEMRHNPAGLARKALVVTALAGAAYYLLKSRSERRVRY